VTQYSVLECLDRLERLLETGTRIPFSSKRAVDAVEILDLIDRIRAVLQEQARRSQAVAGAESAAAKSEVSPSSTARESRKLQPDEAAARERAAELIAEAQAEAEQIRAGAREYAESTLQVLHETLDRTSAVVKNGIEELRRRSARQA